MELLKEWHFPATNPTDFKWGIVAYSFGSQSISPGEEYPPRTSFASYIFHPDKGRVIDEYQLVYITKGGGVFTSDSLKGRIIRIKAGDAFLLFP
ncbi:MAG: AraC family transcriptional regulator, partial [Bacteroidales bacterium]|nr:AraC family transcriptional regulator [Bacteroidales bacterium]